MPDLGVGEKHTVMMLWSSFRSPLMMGGRLPENDQLTLELLTNDEVLAVNQRSTNKRGREPRAEARDLRRRRDLGPELSHSRSTLM